MIRDLAGRSIPQGHQTNASGGTARTIAVPPIREKPNEQSIELLIPRYATLPADGTSILMKDARGQDVNEQFIIQAGYVARVTAIHLVCSDMTATDTTPYLFFSVLVNGQPINAWGNIPVFSLDGLLRVTFEASIDLTGGQAVTMAARNTDTAANVHNVGAYLYGWLYPKGTVQA